MRLFFGGVIVSICQVEITRDYYLQRLNSGVAEREYYLTVKNVSVDATCGADVKLVRLDA